MDYHQHRQGGGELYAQAPSGGHASIVSPFDTDCSRGSGATSSSSIRRDLDESEVLRCINEYRSEHGAPMLRWSQACAREAQLRASHETGPSAEYGENLARSTDHSWRDPTTACIRSIHRWQKEEAGYDYGRPGLSSDTSHFTANVWRLTTHVGFGVFRAKYKGESTMWVVAYFSPRGNQAGDFARNVLPRGSVYDGDDSMVRRAVDTVSPSGRHPREASGGRHPRDAPGGRQRRETLDVGQQREVLDVRHSRGAPGGRQQREVLDVRHSIEAPGGRQQREAPEARQQREAPDARQQREAHDSRQQREAHGGRQQRQAPGGRQQREAHDSRHSREAHDSRQHREAPGGRQQSEAPGIRHAREAPGSRQHREASDGRQQREASDGRHSRGAHGGRQQREGPGGRQQREAHGSRQQREAPTAYVRVETVNSEVKALRSANGKFTFQVLPDRNIIVRQAEKVIWSSGSRLAGKPPVGAPFRLVLQKNGDLVGYDSAARVFWSSETANCGPAPYTLTMQDDGQCVLFDGRWKAMWGTDSRPMTMK